MGLEVACILITASFCMKSQANAKYMNGGDLNMQQMDRQMNRQQKIMAAKASFQRTGDDAGFFYKRDLKEAEQLLNETKNTGPSFHFGLMRFLASVMLLIILLAAFSGGFSYRGFRQEYVEKCMSDETTWNKLEEQVQKLYQNALEQGKKLSKDSAQ